MCDDLVERVAQAICKADGRYDYSQWARELRPVARAALAAIEAAGYVVVPREPTEKMLRAGYYTNPNDAQDTWYIDQLSTWRAMIDAAPEKDKANVR